MDNRRCVVIFGAGKTSRGFLSEVFSPKEWDVTLVDSPELVEKYGSTISCTIVKRELDAMQVTRVEGLRLISNQDTSEMQDLLSRRGAIAAIAVPPMRLSETAASLALAIAQKAFLTPEEPLDILLCVNTPRAQAIVRDTFEALLGGNALEYAREKVGLVQTVVLRTVSEATHPDIAQAVGDPAAVVTNTHNELPVDATAFRGLPPVAPMIRMTNHIEAELEKKLYTVSMATAASAFLGYRQQVSRGAEAMEYASIRQLVEKALREAALGLCAEYGLDEREMVDWNARIVRALRVPELSESIVRLGADSARKLGPHDRLVGPAMLCMKHGIWPDALTRIIAAGYCFAGSDDAGTRRVLATVRQDGIEAALEHYSQIDLRNPLQDAVLAEWERLQGE